MILWLIAIIANLFFFSLVFSLKASNAKTVLTYQDFKSLVREFRVVERANMGEFKYFTKYPERFADEIVGIDLMKEMSEMNDFLGFTDFQIAFMRDFLDDDVPDLFLRCNRGGAKSFLIMYCAVLDIYRHDCIGHRWDIPILAGSERQAGEPYKKYAKKMFKSPVLSPLVYFKKRETIFTGTNSKLMVLAASQTDVKGPRAKVQIIDEICSTPEDVIEEYWGEMITAPNWKCVVAGTPDDPSHVSYEWEHDPKYGFKTHHWNAYDCLTTKGGWLEEKTIDKMKIKYRSVHAQRRNIMGEWSSYGGSILRQEDIDAATQGYHKQDLPDPRDMDLIIICGDPARSNHYATRITLGVSKGRIYVFNSRGWQNIKEQRLRSKYLREAEQYMALLDADDFDRVVIIIEDAPISKALCDNLERECARRGIRFKRSRFGSEADAYTSSARAGQRKRLMKNRFVENMCWVFEEHMISCPREFTLLIGEMISYRWKKMPGKTDDYTLGKVHKGKDDFIDALMHGLMEARRYLRGRRGRKMLIAIDTTRVVDFGKSRTLSKQKKDMLEKREDLGTFIMIRKSNQLR